MLNLCQGERLDRAGMLLLRFEGNPNSKEARKRYGKIKRFLDQTFEYHLGVLEFGLESHVHIHLLVFARDEITSGFCKAAYTQFMAGRHGFWADLMEPDEEDAWLKRLPSYFNPNAHLCDVREQLNRRITKHGFRPVRLPDIAPLIKKPEAVAVYLTKELWTPSSDFFKFVKGTRMIILPRGVPKPVRREFCWHSRRARSHRQKNALVAEYLGLDEVTVKERFGRRDWMKGLGFLRSAIEKEQPFWPEYYHPEFDPAEYCRFLVHWHRLYLK